MVKSDKVQIDFNLNKLEIPDEARSYRFPFRDENFETIDISELAFEDMEEALARTNSGGGSRPLVDLFLGEQAERFWALKPSVWHVEHLAKELKPVLESIVGTPGNPQTPERCCEVPSAYSGGLPARVWGRFT